MLNEDKRDRQVQVQRDDEAVEEERDYHNQEQYNEGEDTQSVKTYVKRIIPLHDDNDVERNPVGTASPKGNITIMLYISVHVSNHEI